MKAYLVSTGSLFALLVAAHIARVAEEGTHLLKEPFFVLVTLASAWLSVWALLLLRTARR